MSVRGLDAGRLRDQRPAGMLIRRVVPAIATTMAAWASLALATRVVPPAPALPGPLPVAHTPQPPRFRLAHRPVVHRAGRKPLQPGGGVRPVPPGQPPSRPAGRTRNSAQTGPQPVGYIAQHGYTSTGVSYLASHAGSWPFQWIEGGWLLALLRAAHRSPPSGWSATGRPRPADSNCPKTPRACQPKPDGPGWQARNQPVVASQPRAHKIPMQGGPCREDAALSGDHHPRKVLPRALTARTTIGQHLTSTTKDLWRYTADRPRGAKVAAPITQICAADLKNDDTGKASHNGGSARVLPDCACRPASQRGWRHPRPGFAPVPVGLVCSRSRIAGPASCGNLACCRSTPGWCSDPGPPRNGMTSGSYPQQLLPGHSRRAVGAMGADERLSQSVPRR